MKYNTLLLVTLLLSLLCINMASANIDSVNKLAWGEDIGWLNFDQNVGGATVTGTGMTGTAWSTNMGWVNLTPDNGGVTLTNSLVNGKCISTLGGTSWGVNTGWINYSGVFIDENGYFYGTASGVNSGDISFSGSTFRLQTSLLPACTTAVDTDGDGVPDAQEIIDGTDPDDSGDVLDTDGDGVPDYLDPNPTTPGDTLIDTDGDGVPDVVEQQQGTDPNDAADMLDADQDGVSDYEESIGNNSGDGDGDGILDKNQSHVSGAKNPATNAYATLKVAGGCDFITKNKFITESSLVADTTADYPVGLVDFELQCANPGESADVTIYYDKIYDTSSWKYKKYNSNGTVYSDITSLVSFSTALVGTTNVTTVSFTVTDGDSDTDEDGIEDSYIHDPSGPAESVSTSSSGSAGGASGGSLNYDRCDGNDTSGSIYDGMCGTNESEENTGEEESMGEDDIPEEENTSETDVSTEESSVIADAGDVEYSIDSNFLYCPKIENIRDIDSLDSNVYFTDTVDSEYANIIESFARNDIVSGDENGDFGPQKNITRAEFLKVVLKTHCYQYQDQNISNLEYYDVDKKSWQAKVIAKAQELEMVNGDTISFDRGLIDQNIGKQYSFDAVSELKKVFTFHGWYDGKIDNYYTQDFVDAVYDFQLKNEIVTNQYQAGAGFWGPSTRKIFFEKYYQEEYSIFRPNDVISRIEALKILLRISGIQAGEVKQSRYGDIDVDWQKNYVENAETLGLLSAENEDYIFAPNSGTRRANMISLIYETIALYK